MISVVWSPRLLLDIDPVDIEVYRVDFSEWLEGETITTATVVGSRIDAVLTTTAASYVDFTASSAMIGECSVEVTATSSAGRRAQRTIRFRGLER